MGEIQGKSFRFGVMACGEGRYNRHAGLGAP
jgi:hypothetical protein